jgi:valyl-tRNA synthetase
MAKTPTKFTTFNHVEADEKGRVFWANWHKTLEVDDSFQGNASDNSAEIEHELCNNEYRMIWPPANITGSLHLGHALTTTIQDVMGRYRMLQGKKVRWIPGTDHAGIATQVVVEKQLRKETGQSRHDIGREAFLQKVWEWKDQKAQTIMTQLQTLSPLIDYSKEQFTMNDDLTKEVSKAFVELYERGLIYRENRMVDYCCELQTVISNIEIDQIEIDGPTKHNCPNGIKADVGRMYSIKYDIDPSTRPEGAEVDHIVVSTTRPETMFGDVCVAVHPDDKRYQNLQGVRLIIPFTNISIPLIYDSVLPNPEMGTGAVKITPAHDPKDYDAYIRRKDEMNLGDYIEIINNEGELDLCNLLEVNPLCVHAECLEKLNKRNRYIARKILVKLLEERSYLVEVKPHKTTLPVCSRTGDILEPKLRSQWFVDTSEMSQKSIAALKSGELQIVDNTGSPSVIHGKTWKRFLQEERPWCISRQLWWGHRIPAYQIQIQIKSDENNQYGAIESQWIVATSIEEARAKADKLLNDEQIECEYDLIQDPDVLDTWFSSGIYPFTILGGDVFPLDVLETGKDILFFWVARMVMLSLTLRNELPFPKVFLHNMVRDKEGRKMSKSLGNVIDPLDVINGITRTEMEDRLSNSNLSKKEINLAIKNIRKNYSNGIKSYGVDSLRMGLMYYMRQDTDINLNVDIFKSAHSLLNKVWQILNLNDLLQEETDQDLGQFGDLEENVVLISNLNDWMDHYESRLLNFDVYESDNLACIYDNFQSYVMNYFAPFYLEAVKVLIFDKVGTYRLSHPIRRKLLNILRARIVRIITFLHPIAPNATLMMSERLGMNIDKLRIPSNYLEEGESAIYDGPVTRVLEIVSQINSLRAIAKKHIGKISQAQWYNVDDLDLSSYLPIIDHLTKTQVSIISSEDDNHKHIKLESESGEFLDHDMVSS